MTTNMMCSKKPVRKYLYHEKCTIEIIAIENQTNLLIKYAKS